MMEWPSKRIPQGGLLHPAKATYSPETHKLLKDLMQESKLTMLQRQKMNYFLRNGEPLPNLCRSRSETRKAHKPPQIRICARPSQRRSQSTIEKSGAYCREQFVRALPLRDREEDKRRLQCLMEYGKEAMEKQLQEKNRPIQPICEEPKPKSRYQELKTEIDERLNWIAEMESLGQAKPYREMIRQQVAMKMHEMQQLKLERS